MNAARTTFLLVLIATIAAMAIRLPRLSQRPMHGDEAVHADKFRDLLENGRYVYDPHEYHGPTLNYATLIPALLRGVGIFSDVTETTLRIVPIACCGLMILFLLGIRDGLGRWGTVFAAGYTAVSPVMVFYSRYYIQEMLLVCFTFGLIVCGWRYCVRPRLVWAMGAGIFLGLMHASKETFVISLAAMGLSLWLCRSPRGKRREIHHRIALGFRLIHLSVFFVAAGGISVLFFSSFFTNPHGVVDSILTYSTYFNRAGKTPMHHHPWYQYLAWLGYYQLGDGPLFSEGVILSLAAIGAAGGLLRTDVPEWDRRFIRFLAFYTLILTVLYSLIPYKTPWCALGFFHGMILLAGSAISRLVLSKNGILASAAAFVIGVGSVHLAWQSYMGNFRYVADSRNPWVYSHTGMDVFPMVDTIRKYASVHPAGKAMHIQVICPGSDYWPLPWYLRDFTQVGYWSEVNNEAAAAELILAMPSVEEELMIRLFERPPPGQRHMYMPLFDRYMELRPQVEIRGYVRKDLWDRYQAREESDVGLVLKIAQ